MLPTFLVIGSARCASTWLHEILRLHPQVKMTQIKELTYFGKECLDHELDWYKSAFRPGPGETTRPVRGDISTWYVRLSRRSVQAVHRLIPDARIVLLMRHPIERAWSGELLQLSREVPDLSKVSITTFLRRFELTRRKAYNDYARVIETWSSVFPRESIHLELFDRVITDPAGMLHDVLQHINADPDWQPPDDLLHTPRHSISQATNGRAADMKMPPIVRWYLARQWAEPMCRLNEEHLDGRVSHWVEELDEIARQKVPASWTLRRAINRGLLIWPERIGYAAFDAIREWRLSRVYRRIEEEQGRSASAQRGRHASRIKGIDGLTMARRLALAGFVSLKLGVILTLMELASNAHRFPIF